MCLPNLRVSMTTCAMCVCVYIQVSTEERSLLSLYPTQYTAYQQSVGKYIPFVH